MSDEAKLNVLTAKRENMFRKIQFLFDMIKSPGLSGQPRDKTKLNQFKVRYDQIDDVYSDYNEITERINILNISINPNSKADFQAVTAFEELYFEIKAFHQVLFPAAGSSADTDLSCSLTCKPAQPRLPKILLPTFDGTLKNWTCFHDKFKSLIHDNPAINPVEKFHYLLSAVTGPALSIVRSLPLTDRNYDIVWNSLTEKYQNKRVLGADLLDTLLSFKPLNKESIYNLNEFLFIFKDSVFSLKALEIPDLSEFILAHLGLRCLPMETRKHFELQYNCKELPSFDTLVRFVQKQVDALIVSKGLDTQPKTREISCSVKSFATKSNISPNRVFTATAPVSSPKRCPVCNTLSHTIYACSEYFKLTPQQRRKIIRDARYCFNCLKGTHMLDACTSKVTCSQCSQRHHSTLHEKSLSRNNDKGQLQVLTTPSNSSSVSGLDSPRLSASGLHSNSNRSSQKTVLLGTAIVHLKNIQGVCQPVRALIDSGAQTSFITLSCVQRLGLITRKCDLPIAGLGQTFLSNIKGMTSCTLKPRSSCNPILNTDAVILSKITTKMPSIKIPADIRHNFDHLILADPTYDVPSSIDFLIAGDLFPFLYDGQRILGNNGVPSALHSIFGWVITGEVDIPSLSSLPVVVSHLSTAKAPLDEVLKRFWEIEEPPLVPPKNPDDERCEQIFQNFHSRAADGKYVVPLPFHENKLVSVGDSYQTALSRLLALERRLSKNPQLAVDYHNFLMEYERLGHMTCVHNSTISDKYVYFIPHHAVTKIDSSTTKLRVVFDGSSKPNNGLSLNSLLLPGPKLQGDIVSIISRFRLHKYVFTADISKMFRQIWIRPIDRKFQHILWRSKRDGPIKEYQLNTVTYGLSAAPYLAQRTLKQLSIDEGEQFPDSAKVITNDIYIDDILTGASSLDAAKELKLATTLLLSKGGFELRKWSSNSSEIISDIPNDHLECPLSFRSDGHEFIKVLGLQWSSTADCFSYRVSLNDIECTKRSILSHVARLYDPLGWLSPVIFRCKCLIQHLWRLGVDWDESVPDYISKEWKIFYDQLPLLEKIQIPRYVALPNVTEIILVGFSDASERGYSASVYLVVKGPLENTSNLVLAKSKVSPLKTLSIPRLELCGALLLSRLLKYLISVYSKVLTIHEIRAFTDSTNVLAWLKTSPHLLKTFIATRVSQILETIPPSSWHHISTNFNPADCSSRGLHPSQLLDYSLWWTGPSWLNEPTTEWPIHSSNLASSSEVIELKTSSTVCSFVAATRTEGWDIIEKCSSFLKLQRVTAWCLRFTSNLMLNYCKRSFGPLSCTELQLALKFLILTVQGIHFANDIKMLEQGQPCQNSIQRLSPFLDSEGLLRVGGRLKHAHLPESSIHPLILPKSSHFTNILVDYYHIKYLHLGPRALQSLIVRKFWILSARNVIRSRISKCITCFKQTASPVYPLMGDLPRPRVTQGRPFINVGIDFGGPFNLKESKRRNAKTFKGYIALFVCFSSKAVHLELVTDLTTDAFLAAFDRFVARRGLCHNVYTDCGTNFIGASRRLSKLFSFLNSSSISDSLSQQGIVWHFNVPAAPHAGGLWESGIRSTKHHLHRVLLDRALTYEEFSTLLAKIEAILNSRPLCPLSNNPSEIDVLTPGHLLTGAPLLAPPELDFSDTPDNHLDRWQHINKVSQHFWNRWSRDYLHTLQQRSKWFKQTPNLKVGDLVLLVDKTPPRQWNLGRVETLHPGLDNIVRVASVRTMTGTYLRPVIKLSPLPFN